MAANRVSIIGAGLGGLTAAIALRQMGFEVTVFEQAEALGEVGAGIQIAANATKVFRALGLEDELLRTACEPGAHVVRAWKSGHAISTTPMKGVYTNRFGAGHYTMHRADLHAVLERAVPREIIRLNSSCTEIEVGNDRVVARFSDGTVAESDVLIGADGIHSSVRKSLYGPDAPRFTNQICYRGLVPTDALPPDLIAPDMTVWFGPNADMVHYYVRSGEYVNWIATHEADDWRLESWRIKVDPNEALQAYAGWHPAVRELICRTETCYKWALFDRDPLPRWSNGRATLLGDAAHPMLPYLAQGACMAIEDAYALALFLSEDRDDPKHALAAYEASRRPRTSEVQLIARARAATNHIVSPLGRLRRDIGYKIKKLMNPAKHTYNVDWIYGHDISTKMGTL